MEERCRLKAEGARWAAKRRRLIKGGADFETEVEPHDTAIIARAKALPNCFLWMCHPSVPPPNDLTLYDHLAGSFEAAAAAVNLLHHAVNTPGIDQGTLEQALHLGAEAQSALRIAVADVGGNPDSDQARLFSWLRSAGATHAIWISRFMRQDDPADPANWPQLQERIRQFDDVVHRYQDRDKRTRKQINKLKYHLKRIKDAPQDDHGNDWKTIIETVTGLVLDGVPPSNKEVRDLLMDSLDEMPDMEQDKTKEFRLVETAIDNYQASAPSRPVAAATERVAPEVLRAAELIGGRSVMLIGGVRRPAAAEALSEALNLKELIWVEGRDQTYTSFEPQVANPDVALVVLAIRWSRHGFGEVKEYCQKYGKPLVRLPGGYNPNQVAYHIVHQVGDRLAGKPQEMPV
jgi:hypothetical protein